MFSWLMLPFTRHLIPQDYPLVEFCLEMRDSSPFKQSAEDFFVIIIRS